MEKRERIVFDYIKKCPVCGKEIKGSSEVSLENNLRVHILTQHEKENKKPDSDPSAKEDPEAGSDSNPVQVPSTANTRRFLK